MAAYFPLKFDNTYRWIRLSELTYTKQSIYISCIQEQNKKYLDPFCHDYLAYDYPPQE